MPTDTFGNTALQGSPVPTGVATSAPYVTAPLTVGAVTSTLAQDQARTANQGKAGYDAFGDPVKAPVQQPAKPPQSVTAFSSDTASKYALDNTQTLASLRNNGLTVGADGLARFSDSSFATAPSDAVQNPDDGTWQSGGVKYAIGPTTSVDPELQKINDTISGMKTQFDTTSRAVIDNIKQQFDQLIKQQGDINTRSQASLDQSLLMSGSSRYAQQSSTGQSTTMMSYGLQQLADLNTKEQTAVLQAQQAQDNGDMKLMDQSLQIAQQARKDKQDAAQKLSDALTTQANKVKADQQQSAKDSAVGQQLSNGVTDPTAIIAALAQQGIVASVKDVADTISNLSPDAAAIHTAMLDAAKYGAPADVLKTIGSARNLTDAYSAAGKYLTDPTSNVGQYNAYAARAKAAGQTPISAEDFLAKQKYNEAYNTKSAQNAADAAYASSDKGQNALEQQYRTTLLKEVSNRSGGLGLQDAKVNQAIHLKALVDQFKDPKTGDYNVPTSQYYELAIGLASLVSGTNTTSDSDRKEIAAKTASGDLRGALQYITGTPQNGNTQDMIKNLIGSIDRQGQVAEDLRDQDVSFLKGLAPTGLSQDRINALNKTTLPSYRNPPVNQGDQIIKDESNAKQRLVDYGTQHPDQREQIASDAKTLEQTLGRKATNAEFLEAFPEYGQ